MAKRTKNNIIVLIALAVLCLTASGSFWTGGQADAVYSPPVWDLPLFEAEDAPESMYIFSHHSVLRKYELLYMLLYF